MIHSGLKKVVIDQRNEYAPLVDSDNQIVQSGMEDQIERSELSNEENSDEEDEEEEESEESEESEDDISD
jgi:hypothetical protein